MRKGWIALTVCAGVAAGFMLTTTKPTQAAMVIGDGKVNMSLVEQIKKKKSKVKCEQKLFFKCCAAPGKPEVCDIKM
jgi:hypothetical protein